jgi:superfamily II DNA or RNA helicase
MSYQFQDFILNYPFATNPLIQNIYTEKKEFEELHSDLNEKIPTRGSLYKSQKLFLRTLIAFDRILNISNTGTGKTCSVVAVAEYYKRNKASINRVYVLQKRSTIQDFKYQLVYKCTCGEYDTESIRNIKHETAKKINISKEINKWYTIETYNSFAHKIIKEKYTDEDIINYYSGSLFIVDEAHNLRNDKEDKEAYSVIHRVFHLIKRSKIIISTATPMINDVNEIAKIANLILPSDKQMPDINYSNASLDEIGKYLNGYIFYVRSLETGAYRNYIGEKMKKTFVINSKSYQSQTVVYYSKMIGIQNTVYTKLVEEDQMGVFYINLKEASSFVFPDGTYGGSGFNKYVNHIHDNYELIPEFKKEISNINRLKKLSSKFAKIIEIETSNNGCSFCYSELVSGSGVILLGLCFEAYGFVKFNLTSSVFDSKREIIPTFPKMKRYGLLTSETPDTVINSLLEIFNSKENIHGEYVQTIIGSQVTREGINIYNVVRGHIIISPWHPSGLYQATSRFMRAVSHDALIEEKKKELESMLDRENVRIPVDIYYHVAIAEDPAILSVDEHIYEEVESKSIPIHFMMRILKQLNLGCRIDYTYNVRSTYSGDVYISGDENGSENCDYQDCHYKCFKANEIPEKLDFSTYDIFYANEVIKFVCIDIINLLKEKNTITFNELYDKYVKTGIYRERFIYMAVDKLINDKEVFLNQYGFRSFINTDGFNIFIQREFPSKNILSNYGGQLIAIKNVPFSYIIDNRLKLDQEKIINDIKQLSYKDKKTYDITLNLYLEKLELSFLIKLVEEVIIESYKKQVDTYIKPIYNKYKSYIFTTYEPTTDILEISKLLNAGKSKFNYKVKESKEGNIVYMHTLYSITNNITSYSVTSKFRNAGSRIRIYIPAVSNSFRDVEPAEFIVYSEIIQNKIKRIVDKFEEFPYYGSIETDNKFRIHASNKETLLKDKRLIHHGRVCSTINKPELFFILTSLGIKSKKLDKNIIVGSKDDLIKSISIIEKSFKYNNQEELNKLDENKLILLFQWYKYNPSKEYICKKIKKYFEKNKSLMVL